MSRWFEHPDEYYAQEATAIGREFAEHAKSNGGRKAQTSFRNDNRPPTAKDIRHRAVTLTKASTIRVQPVRWLWQERMPLGALVLMAGREGIGKSICIDTLAADITRGRLAGVFAGTPRSIIVAATEDSWSHTLVPRFMAADADLDRIYRVDVTTADLGETELSLPKDLPGLEEAVKNVDAALVILDPLMSRLDVALDTHKDGEVRRALEPVVTLAERTVATFVGLIHVNKSGSSDPLTAIMGSRAFTAVARSVLFVMMDPDDENVRLLGTPKNNLGRSDLATLSFRIVGAKVAETSEGDVWTGVLRWAGETTRTIRDALEQTAESSGDKTATGEAGDWLQDYLASQGGSADSADLRREGAKAGHSKDALRRAKQRLGIISITSGFPRRAFWSLPASQCAQTSRETSPTAHTALTAHTGGPVGAVGAVSAPSQEAASTGADGEPFTFDPSTSLKRPSGPTRSRDKGPTRSRDKEGHA
jgi:AAA domain